jgi:hypothetical protein
MHNIPISPCFSILILRRPGLDLRVLNWRNFTPSLVHNNTTGKLNGYLDAGHFWRLRPHFGQPHLWRIGGLFLRLVTIFLHTQLPLPLLLI